LYVPSFIVFFFSFFLFYFVLKSNTIFNRYDPGTVASCILGRGGSTY
jgi:hypothetical protein